MRLAPVLALVLLLVLAAPAGAASVAVTSRCDKMDCIHTARYTAAPGERNALTVSEGPGTVTFHDDGAVVEPRAGCVAVDAHTARCEPPPYEDPESLTGSARLGDRDDISSSGYAGVTAVALAGRFAAALDVSGAFREERSEDRIAVADPMDASTRETCVSGGVRSFLLTAEGGVACAVEAEIDTSIRRRTRQIRSEDAVIDEGPGIDLRSLHRRGDEIAWRHDGVERTAPLPRPG